jgi:hypothetical protein
LSDWQCTWWSGDEGPSTLTNGTKVNQGGSGNNPVPVGTVLALAKLDIQSAGYSAVTGVDWDLDGDGVFEHSPVPILNVMTAVGWYASSHRFTPISTTATWSTPGEKAVGVRVHYADGSSETATGTVPVVVDAAVAGITVSPSVTLTGREVRLSAATSTALSGAIGRYEWDLNGDGLFETDGASTISNSWNSAGTKTVGVRVTSRGGGASAATISVEVRKAPPDGEPGVSINDGSPYTNKKAVQLALVWPEFATEARVSNDGGFARSKTEIRELANSVEWTLDDSLTGVFTKNVYVRFSGSSVDASKSYSDDIVLDTNPPTISGASMSSGSGLPALTLSSARKARQTVYVVSMRAKDDKSGVVSAQLNTRPSAKGAKSTAFATRIRVRAKSSVVWLRVRDGAGNFSKWRKLSARVG